MEILDTFDVRTDLKAGLAKFKKWLDGFDPATELGAKTSEKPPATKEELFHTKHRSARTRWVAPDSFPSDRVMKAYQNPVVDKSETPFSWGSPDVDGLVAFCERNIGWPRQETMRFLGPVINNVKTGYRQTRIDSYMKYDDGIKFADIKSKRLRDVLGLTGEKDSGAGKRQRKSI
jgi:DNA excision repair protein ERCC-5